MPSAVATMPPPLPTPSRPAMGLKRDSSHLSSPSTNDSFMSSQKRLKVAFDDNVDIRILDDYNSKPMELVREEVRSAIEGHLRLGDERDETGYEQLRWFFMSAGTVEPGVGQGGRDEKPSTALLWKYVVALRARVNELKGCVALVTAVLDINWVGRDEAFINLYMRFLGALGSVMPAYVRPVMERIVRNFAMLPSSLGRVPGEPVVSRPQLLTRLHKALAYLLRLIPSASSGLAGVLRNEFPNHHITTRRAYIAYIKNMLRIREYAPELRAEMLTLITERLVKIDVEVQEEIDELEDDADEIMVVSTIAAPHAAEDSDDSSGSDSDSASSTALSTSDERRLKALRETVSKLDAVLDILFDHYTAIFTDGKIFEQNDTFEHILSQFCTFVLPTYRSRHTQFLLFHFAQLTPAHSERFVATCIRLSLGRGGIASNGSISAAAYLASFVARGARVPRRAVRDIFLLLGSHLTNLLRGYEASSRGPDLGRYGLYYAVAQALLYIFCFRWRDLIEPDYAAGLSEADLVDFDVFVHGEPRWLLGVKECLTKNIYSRLNPLKVCSPAIVLQFAAIAAHLRFLFVFPLLETNKRLRLSSYRGSAAIAGADMGVGKREGALSRKGGEGHHQLDAFFPFDPYSLPKSKKWLEGDYNMWRGVPGMNAGRELEDDDASEVESDEEDDVDVDEELDDVASQSS